MICKPCQESIDHGIKGKMAHVSHGCKGGTHCDCQHREGPREQWIQSEWVDDLYRPFSRPDV